MEFEILASQNETKLKSNIYPGRGLIIGMSPTKKYIFQIYWIMGRSKNSRNRIFEKVSDYVRTKAFDEDKLVDPSLIIYYPIKSIGNSHIVSNGDQTDTIYEYIKTGRTFEEALLSRTYEPDAPNYTPRISGIVNLMNDNIGYKLSIIKSIINNPEFCNHNFFYFNNFIPGCGHCIHTYESDGNPLPSFNIEPYILKIHNCIEKNAKHYWSILNNENMISLLVKQINLETLNTRLYIINKNK